MFYKIIVWFLRLAFTYMILWYGLVYPFLMWKGRDFPQESEIQYSEGKFYFDEIRTASRSGSKVTDAYLLENGQKIRYYCGYSAYHNPSLQDCFPNDKNIRAYVGKTVRVGWYYQKDFLWFHNPYKQLVDFKVNGEHRYHFYDKQQQNMKDANFGLLIFSALVMIFGSMYYYLLFLSKNRL